MTRLVIVDLDGTLIPGNSFHAWIRFLAGWAWRSRHFVLLSRVLSAAGLRLVRIIDHQQLKRMVLRASTQIPPTDLEEFGSRLVRSARGEVLRRVAEDAAQGLVVVLVTAAPEIYLAPLARALSADAALGTRTQVDKAWVENTGDLKWIRIQAEFGEDAEIDTLYTDHADDLPLARRARKTVVVAPSDASWRVLRTAGRNVQILAGETP